MHVLRAKEEASAEAGGVRFHQRGAGVAARRDAGYTLVAIMVFMTLLAIAVLVVSPSISKIMQRDRELELMFRGRQYAQAFLNFQKRQGRFPLNLAELMTTKPRSARQLYKEPMCNCSDWGLIRVGQPWPPPTTSTSSNPAGGLQFDTNPTSSSGSSTTTPGTDQTRPGSPLPGTYSLPPASGTSSGNPTDASGGTGTTSSAPGDMDGGLNLGGPTGTVSNVPIIGVYSKVHKMGLRTFHGFQYYDQWGFIAGANNDPDLPSTLPAGTPVGFGTGSGSRSPSAPSTQTTH